MGDQDEMSSGWASSTLKWWSDAGVDVIVGETAHDWLAPVPRSAAEVPAPTTSPTPPMPTTLADFQAWLVGEADLPGAASSAPRLGPSGKPESAVMVLTDAPTLEDFSGSRLVSSDGLFDRMLAAIGLSRDTIYLASLSPFRPPSGNLAPASLDRLAEVARHHIALIRPRALLLLGDVCSRALTGAAVNQARSKWHEIETNDGRFRALVTLKPEQLLKQPNLKNLAWADLQMLKKGIEE